ncbi:MAG: helix-turn-helix domain-containing protein [Chloroflexi bacterium]|nr:helix-turn-helix domain-containing protein [Chloroflexota bacterium]
MLTVPEAARRLRRNPETVRRWIREGRLRSTKVGTQHLVEEADLDQLRPDVLLPAPDGWWTESHTGEPLPDFMAVLRRQRTEH